MPPKVSVIMPVYNVAPYLAEALQSVFAQSFTDYEIIVVDDGSTDGTAGLLRSYGSRLKVFTKENSGPAAARNRALKEAKGEYLAFLDGDDLWLKDKLQKQVRYLDQHSSVMLLYAESLMFSTQGHQRVVMDKIGYTEAPTFALLLHGDFIPNSTVVIRRSCLEKVGYLLEDLAAAEDYEYWMRIAWQSPFTGLAQPLAYYRIRPESLLGNNTDIEKGLSFSLEALRRIEQRYPQVWQESGVNRAGLFARLCLRAGFAWRQRGSWRRCFEKYLQAFSYYHRPLVLRWMIAATVLKRWS